MRWSSLAATRAVAAVVVGLVAAGCDSPTGVRTGFTPAPVVMGTGDDSFIVVALTDRRVHVSFTSYGGGCERQHEVRWTVEGMTALVEPINRYSVPEHNVCTRELGLYHHQQVLQFPESGAATVRLRGRSGGSMEEPVTSTLEKVVVLQ
jgi:hypothetical protein